jgi:hypothetical protein
MREWLRRWWPWLKALLGVAIVLAIGRQFWRDLSEHPEVLRRRLHAGWLVLSGVLYLLGMGFSAVYWRRLMAHLGYCPPWWPALRAYYVSHMGKYLPGKAMALVLRATLLRRVGVPGGLAAVTALYEVLTTMSAGALLAAVLFAWLGPQDGATPTWAELKGILLLEVPPSGFVNRPTCVLLSLGLFALTAAPLAPPLFNRLIGRLTRQFRGADAVPPPPFRLAYLAEGWLLTTLEWLLWGASLATAMEGTVGTGLRWNAAALGRLVALMGLSYVAGFVILLAPSGLGVREFFLRLFLTSELAGLRPEGHDEAAVEAVLVVVVLRLVWTLAEVILVLAVYWLPGQPTQQEMKRAN